MKPRKLRIDLFYRLAHIPAVKERHPAQMLFTLPEAHERLRALLADAVSETTHGSMNDTRLLDQVVATEGPSCICVDDGENTGRERSHRKPVFFAKRII